MIAIGVARNKRRTRSSKTTKSTVAFFEQMHKDCVLNMLNKNEMMMAGLLTKESFPSLGLG